MSKKQLFIIIEFSNYFKGNFSKIKHIKRNIKGFTKLDSQDSVSIIGSNNNLYKTMKFYPTTPSQESQSASITHPKMEVHDLLRHGVDGIIQVGAQKTLLEAIKS